MQITFRGQLTTIGRPSGVFARILPSFMRGWFTWKRTEDFEYSAPFHYRPIEFSVGGLKFEIRKTGSNIELVYDNMVVQSVSLDGLSKIAPVKISAAGFTLSGNIAVVF